MRQKWCIVQQTSEYHQFCKDVGINAKDNRLRYEAGTSDLKKTEAWKNFNLSIQTSKKVIADSTDYDKIDTTNEEKVVDVHIVGKIDKDIYKCITEDIVTDEVIITDERIQHIKDRHPNDYERFYSYLKDIVEHPQYIVETNKPNTALILKEFTNGTEKFKTVLRLITSTDDADFKNSIITFMKINDKEWSRLLRNKKILYKKE